MEKLITGIFDYFEAHPWHMRLSLAVITLGMLFGITRLSYREDIEDFLPLGSEDHENLDTYQQISGASELVVMFDEARDVDSTTAAIDEFTDRLQTADTCHWTKGMISHIDEDAILEIVDEIYTGIPYFLTDSDYERMDSLLAEPHFVEQRLTTDRDMLQYPTGGFAEKNIARDPLGLFLPTLQKLQSLQRESRFQNIDGYIFTPDTVHAIVLVPSPFGNNETEQNSRLLQLVHNALDSTTATYPTIRAHITGGPSIAVSNATCIKQDSILATILAGGLIITLLIYSFRSIRNIALTALTILWGGLFALAGMSIVHSEVSLIVLGISSIIIGIAFNYPLHLINHLAHSGSEGSRVQKALGEITKPLLVGNITTIGAFLALVPLKSTALRDLGIFASLILFGTILFVLVFLPHLVKGQAEDSMPKARIIDRLAHLQPEKNKALVAIVCILTVIFGIESLGTQFDPVMSHINYMTAEQRTDMDYFHSVATPDATNGIKTVYMSSSAKTDDEALMMSERQMRLADSLTARGIIHSHTGITGYIPSTDLQKHRLARWKRFLQVHHRLFYNQMPAAASRLDFTSDAFTDLYSILNAHYTIQPYSHFSPLTSTIFNQNHCHDNTRGKVHIVDMLYVPGDNVSEVERLIPGTFDIDSVNTSLADSITDDFNYIGWVCSIVVFMFLWYSFRSLKLAIISFMPMALSWLWILGIMNLCDIRFNIVNIILATFIFGQGDDYTIFMTEGCLYEQKYHRPMLASYKNSIVLSALIMFVGIGVLAIARHPALQSLGIVTIVGMFSVVLMAYMIPPLMINKFIVNRGAHQATQL